MLFKTAVLIIGIFILVSVSFLIYTQLNKPKGPSYPEQGKGYPNVQLNAAADAARKSDIENIGSALKSYYSQFGKSPDNLDVLVSAKLIPSIPLDQLTKQPPTYYSSDEQSGCRVEFQLSDGSFAKAYCK